MSTLRLDRQDPYLRVLCINIFVRDQDRSLRFYVDQLGFGLVMDESYESAGRWVAVAPPDGSTVLALVTPKRKSEEYKLIGRSKHAVLVTEDVNAKFEQWRKQGVRFHHPPQMTLWGGIFTRFDDLDGNSFVLVGRDDFVRESKPSVVPWRKSWRQRDVPHMSSRLLSNFRRSSFHRLCRS